MTLTVGNSTYSQQEPKPKRLKHETM